jgi:hypothetical protein
MRVARCTHVTGKPRQTANAWGRAKFARQRNDNRESITPKDDVTGSNWHPAAKPAGTRND